MLLNSLKSDLAIGEGLKNAEGPMPLQKAKSKQPRSCVVMARTAPGGPKTLGSRRKVKIDT